MIVTKVVKASWPQYCDTLDRAWVTLRPILQEIILARGDNIILRCT